MRNVCWWFVIGNQLRLLWCHKATAAFGTTFTSVHQNSAVGTWLMYTYIPWILFSSVAALVHTTVAAPSGPCVSWLAPASASCSLQSALSWSRGSPCFILSPGHDLSDFPDLLFSRAYPPVRPPSLCLCMEQMSGAPSASSARHLFGVICPPTAFALHVEKVFVSFIFIFFVGVRSLAQHRLPRTSVLSALFIPVLRTW